MPLFPGTPDELEPPIPAVVQTTQGAGAAITYTLVAINGAGQDSLPSAPFVTGANNAATPNNTISWDLVPGAVGYRVLKNGNVLATVGPSITYFIDSAGAAGTTYVSSTSNPPIVQPNSPMDGGKATYRASIIALASAASTTDLFTITGSATKTVRVTRLEVSGQQTNAAAAQVVIAKRSLPNTLGTSTAPTAVAHDSNSPAATATVLAYTANPGTLGTLVGNLYVGYVFLAAAATATVGSDKLVLDYGNRPAQAIVLRGTSQVLAVNLNAATVTGGAFNINIEWTEE